MPRAAVSVATPHEPGTILETMLLANRLDELRSQDASGFRSALAEFYLQSDYEPSWLREGLPTEQASRLIESLEHAGDEGLDPADYDGPYWRLRLAALRAPHSPADEARFDVALTASALRYVHDLRVGRTDPRDFNFATRESDFDLTGAVLRLADADDAQSEIAALEPPSFAYRQLQRALVQYARVAGQDDGEPLPVPQRTVYPGARYAGTPRLFRLLRLLGDLPPGAQPLYDPQLYDGFLVQAVQRFQERHSLLVNGCLDRATIEQLNVPLSERVEQIRLSMERLRWLRQVPRPAVVINIPAYRLDAIDERGRTALSMAIGVGDDDARTPLLQATIEYLVFRPYWYVPAEIQKDEIVSVMETDPAYLRQFRFEVVTPGGKVVTSNNFGQTTLQGLSSGRLRLRQRPGTDNSLGLLKFIFPNPYDVYLHDTPPWANNFAIPLTPRSISHGCVRVQKPALLAAWLLRQQRGWDLKRITQAMQHGRNDFRVNLIRPVPLLILYSTAFPDETGQVHFYRDIYGYDSELEQALDNSSPRGVRAASLAGAQ